MANQRISEQTRERITAAWPALLDRIAAGDPIGEAIKAAGFTGGQLRAYRALSPEADSEWQRAKEESADALADDIRAEANNRTADPAFARVRIDALKWLASKRNPRVYNDKAQLDVNVRTVDLTRIISEANQRLAQRSPRILEAELVPDLARLTQLS
jgi:hypothetical protein